MLKDQRPLSTIVFNEKDRESMAFIQTAEMLELFKRNYESGILIT